MNDTKTLNKKFAAARKELEQREESGRKLKDKLSKLLAQRDQIDTEMNAADRVKAGVMVSFARDDAPEMDIEKARNEVERLRGNLTTTNELINAVEAELKNGPDLEPDRLSVRHAESALWQSIAEKEAERAIGVVVPLLLRAYHADNKSRCHLVYGGTNPFETFLFEKLLSPTFRFNASQDATGYESALLKEYT